MDPILNIKKEGDISPYLAAVASMSAVILSEDGFNTLVYLTNPGFNGKKDLEKHRENPYVVRHIFFDEQMQVALLDFQCNKFITTLKCPSTHIFNISNAMMKHYIQQQGIYFDDKMVPHLKL